MKKFLALILAMTIILASCGGDDSSKKNETKTEVSTTETKEDKADKAENEEKKSESKLGKKKKENASKEKEQTSGKFVLDKEFQGRFATMKVAQNWIYASNSLAKKDDTTYYYFNKVGEMPFFMYQFELTDANLHSLTDAEWDGIFANSDAVRLGAEEHNGIQFQYGIAEKLSNIMDMLIFYTFDKGVLQAFAMVLPLGMENQREEYKNVLIDILNTVSKNEAAINNAFDESTENENNSSLNPEKGSLSEEFDSVKLKDITLAVPKGWQEISNQGDEKEYTIVYKSNSNQKDAFMFQRSDFDRTALQGNGGNEDLIKAFITMLQCTVGEDVEINGVQYTAALPGKALGTKITGYVGSVKGATYSFFHLSTEEENPEDNLAAMRKIIEASKFE